jgi:uncharacterized membrane protein YraQ (UPF0718 family)
MREKSKKTNKRSHFNLFFLIFVISLYLVLYIFFPGKIQNSLKTSAILFIHIFGAIAFVFLFMIIMDYLADPKSILRYVGRGSGARGCLLAVSSGILSHGPVYIWYPLLKDLREKGMEEGLIAVFLYNRAVKIPLLPLMIYYFRLPFVIVLLFYMIVASIIEGKIINMVERY